MKLLQLLILGIVILITSAEPPTKHPFGYFQNRYYKNIKPPNHLASGRRTLVLQIRSDSPVPIVLKRPHRQQQIHSPPGRPVKLGISPMFMLKSTPMLGKHVRKPTAVMKINLSSSTKPQSEYIYEKPFQPASASEINKRPIENNIHLTANHVGPIRTIPAPNLNTQDNHIHRERPFLTPHPNAHHYQVTEEPTNDQTVLDPLSGQHKYFAPDPDPSYPAPKVPVAIDPFSIPSNGHPLPSDIQSNFLTSTSSATQAPNQLVHFINPIPQQQLGDTYGIPISNQPQLQQFILQQTSSAQRMPLAAYNPTYLVTQSNNLYNQHQQQQQLFRPNLNYLESVNKNVGIVDLTHEVASEGQILQAAKDSANQIHSQYNVQESGSHHQPNFAALIGNPSNYNIVDNVIDQQQQQHPGHLGQVQESEQAYNADSSPLQGGFVVSNYFGNAQQPTSYQEQSGFIQNQYLNHLKLQQANEEFQQLQQYQQQQHQQQQHQQQQHQQQQQLIPQNSHSQYPEQENTQLSDSAYDEHHRLLEKQLGSSPLRIFVPDEEYQSDNSLPVQRRSDDYSGEEISEEEENSSPITEIYRDDEKRD